MPLTLGRLEWTVGSILLNAGNDSLVLELGDGSLLGAGFDSYNEFVEGIEMTGNNPAR